MALDHAVVSGSQWLQARKELLKKEKEFTRLRDELSQQRRDLPWEAVTGQYVFEGPDGKRTLADLFEGRSQLVIYHLMFGPEWAAGCPICSFWADNFNNIVVHLNHRDVTMIAVSHAPYEKLAAYQRRMGWGFKWYSSFESDFNFDYQVSFTPEDLAAKLAIHNYTGEAHNSEHAGISVFYKDTTGAVFHTYSTYARGLDMLNVCYHYLDLVPKGRDEDSGDARSWVRRRDEYQR
jgi:predicted dithiol-disulfide oxidoreductase (DUF899 family)